MLYVVGFNDEIPEGHVVINTTSRSKNWSKGLSPFFLNPGKLYGNYKAQNVENAWQYSKVYDEHLDSSGNIKEDYFHWAENGFNSKSADRYPKGKNRKPVFSYWDGNKYDYITARKKIYAPIYTRAVLASRAYKQLKKIYYESMEEGKHVYLQDFDGYNHIQEGLTFNEVINNPNRKMGHAFIIWYLIVIVKA